MTETFSHHYYNIAVEDCEARAGGYPFVVVLVGKPGISGFAGDS